MAKMGAPPKYTPEIIALAKDYIENWHKEKGIVIPSQVGLALHCDISLSTVKNWGKDLEKPDFLAIFEKVGQMQHKILVNNGLTGSFNSTITKVMLTKHGYRDESKIDQTITDLTKVVEDLQADGSGILPDDDD